MTGDDDLIDSDFDLDSVLDPAGGDGDFSGDVTGSDDVTGPDDVSGPNGSIDDGSDGNDPTQVSPDGPDTSDNSRDFDSSSSSPDESQFPGMPCWCDGDVPDDLEFDPVDPQELPVDPTLDTIVGNPAEDSAYWVYQGDGNGTCAPTSVAMILSDVLGQDVPSDVVIERAIELGVLSYDPSQEGLDAWSGMNESGVMVLAESFGLDVDLRYGDTSDLVDYLAAGHSITVGLDADEIWYGVDDDSTDGGTDGNHQVVVTGIDPVNGLVYLNDSGNPDGLGEVIPLSQFEDAWADTNNSMIVTDLPNDEAATQIDVDELNGDTSSGAVPYEGIVPADATYFIPPADDGTDPGVDPVPGVDPNPDDAVSAPVIDLDRIRIEGPVPASEGLAQMLILPFTFLVRLADRVL